MNYEEESEKLLLEYSRKMRGILDIFNPVPKFEQGKNAHIKYNRDIWQITCWPSDITNILPGHGKRDLTLPKSILKLLSEAEQCDYNPAKCVLPEQHVFTLNKIAKIGMQESIDRDINGSATYLRYVSLGDDGTAEDDDHTNLQNELSGGSYARKDLDSVGTRRRAAETLVIFASYDNDVDLPTSPDTLKESGIHWSLTGDNNLHARAAFPTFTAIAGGITVVQMVETQQNGTL